MGILEDEKIAEHCAECEKECSEKCLIFRTKLFEATMIHDIHKNKENNT